MHTKFQSLLPSRTMEAEIQKTIVHNLENYYDDDDDEQVYNDEEHVSDCESTISNGDYNEESLFGDVNLAKLDKDDLIHKVIHDKFMACLGDDISNKTTITSIHKKIWSVFHGGESRLRCFEIYRKSLKDKYGDDINMKYAWYATSKKDVTRIMSRGFGAKDLPIYNGLFGDGIYLYPINFLKQSVESCVADDDGLMHIILCRVLLDTEDIGTDYDSLSDLQSISDEFNSEIEDNEDKISTTKYVVRSTTMNTHILPEYVVSFKNPFATPKNAGFLLKKPKSQWLTLSTLMSALAKLLPPKELKLIYGQHRDFKERKISRLEYIQKLKLLVGVDLLATIVKLCGVRKVHYPKAITTHFL
ncbi:hypothetical protein RND81_10G228200 [Saponaria officinalis]|uniref:Poly [ADP-ribose] polymerase n=1 Tax=Saponaria officinalis TaxID=3572 RepID=A0AAW1I7M7_SAPOF